MDFFLNKRDQEVSFWFMIDRKTAFIIYYLQMFLQVLVTKHL